MPKQGSQIIAKSVCSLSAAFIIQLDLPKDLSPAIPKKMMASNVVFWVPRSSLWFGLV